MKRNPDSFKEDILAAKEFADAYGPELLERLIRLAEVNQSLPEQPKYLTAFLESGEYDGMVREVKDAGFEVNSWLENLIETASVEVIRNAIALVEQKRRQGTTVWNPEGLLVEAIRNKWQPTDDSEL